MSETENRKDRNLGGGRTEAGNALRGASAVETLRWVQDRLSAGEDGQVIQLIRQREQRLAGRIEAAARSSIEHQVYRMGRSNYHLHLFSIPLLIESTEPITEEMLDLAQILPLLMRTLRENGLTGRNGLLLNRIIEHSKLTALGLSDLYGLGREMFMRSMAATNGQGRSPNGRLRVLSEPHDPHSCQRLGGGALMSAHLIGCIYSTRAAETYLETVRNERLLPRLAAVLEFVMGNGLPVRVKVGMPESMCAALGSARRMHFATVVEDLMGRFPEHQPDLRAHVTMGFEGPTGDRSLSLELRHRGVVVAGVQAELSMYEDGVVEEVLQGVAERVLQHGMEKLEIEYAPGQTRH